jgi:hypothetical protein
MIEYETCRPPSLLVIDFHTGPCLLASFPYYELCVNWYMLVLPKEYSGHVMLTVVPPVRLHEHVIGLDTCCRNGVAVVRVRVGHTSVESVALFNVSTASE